MNASKITCPVCNTDQVAKKGFDKNKKQRYQCQNKDCHRKVFLLDYTHKGSSALVKKQIIEMARNGSNTREIARALDISMNTIISELERKRIKYS